MPPVQVDAAKSNRSLVDAAAAPARAKLKADPRLLMWRRLIDHAVSDACRTRAGVPTDIALLQRAWLEAKPPRTDKHEWQCSFECACGWLSIDDVEGERTRLLAKVDATIQAAALDHLQMAIYVRRGCVMACAGSPTAIARQFLMPLVHPADYEDVAGVCHGDPDDAFDLFTPMAAA
jgi:hypothetical protein